MGPLVSGPRRQRRPHGRAWRAACAGSAAPAVGSICVVVVVPPASHTGARRVPDGAERSGHAPKGRPAGAGRAWTCERLSAEALGSRQQRSSRRRAQPSHAPPARLEPPRPGCAHGRPLCSEPPALCDSQQAQAWARSSPSPPRTRAGLVAARALAAQAQAEEVQAAVVAALGPPLSPPGPQWRAAAWAGRCRQAAAHARRPRLARAVAQEEGSAAAAALTGSELEAEGELVRHAASWCPQGHAAALKVQN